MYIVVHGCSPEGAQNTSTEQLYDEVEVPVPGGDTAGTNQTGSDTTVGEEETTPQTGWNVDDDPDPDDLAKNCASYSEAAKKVEKQVEKEVPVEIKLLQPVSIYIVLDQSGSMWVPDVATLVTDLSQLFNSFKWVAAVDAITEFVNDTNSAGINVALQYFPLAGGNCDGSAYETPSVPMGRLPDNATAITNSLGLGVAGGDGTPTEPALIGATEYCAQFKQDAVANPEGEDCAVIFITDGLPSSCNTDSTYLAGIAADAYNNHGVTTFAIGMAGAEFNMLNQLAEAGQGEHDCHPDDPLFYACNVSLPDMTLLQALELIRSYIVKEEITTVYETVYETEVLDCEWEIPEPPTNEVFNKDEVNVVFTDDSGLKNTIPRTDSAATCGDKVAWYYNDEGTRIVACPQACTTIQSADFGTIDIVLGCEVVILE